MVVCGPLVFQTGQLSALGMGTFHNVPFVVHLDARWRSQRVCVKEDLLVEEVVLGSSTDALVLHTEKCILLQLLLHA